MKAKLFCMVVVIIGKGRFHVGALTIEFKVSACAEFLNSHTSPTGRGLTRRCVKNKIHLVCGFNT